MEELARDTGGKAYYNSNGLSDAMAHAINNGSRYYTLAYSPGNKKMDGKFRKIQVKLLGDNYKLSYRQGYYADEVPKGSTGKFGDDTLMPLLVHGLPDSTQVLYKIHVAPVNMQPDPNADIAGGNTRLKRPVTRYGVDFAIAEQDIKLETTPDGVRHGNIEVAMIVYDRDGTPLNWVIRKPVVSLDPMAYASLEQVGLQLHLEIDVPPGNVFLHSGIYDSGSNKAGTLEVPLGDVVHPVPAPKN